MDDSSNSEKTILLKENDNISDVNDVNEKLVQDECFKSYSAAKERTKHMAEWSIVYFETDEEDIDEGFHDLVPSSWITRGTLSWYPINENRAIIHKLVKQCAKPGSEWNCFSIKKIEENIDNYDRGMRMLVKIEKNPSATLYSDIEEKGKGKRLKKPIKYFDESDKENLKKRFKVQSTLPPIPKLMSKSAHPSQPLPDKVNEKVKRQTLPLDTNEQRSVFVSHRINVPYEIPKNKNHKECKGIKPSQESSRLLTEMHKSSTIASEKRSHENFSLSGCKIHSKMNHKCAYTSEEVTLESVADAICYLNAEVLSSKLILRKMDKNIESFLETQTMDKPKIENPIIVPVLDEFPIASLDDLKKMERKLKKDKTFHSKVVNALHLGVMGDSSIQKKINSVLRMVLHDNLASSFNWKGQRGNKLKLSGRRITKIMIEAVAKEIPTINETMFGRKAGPWLAQATFRIKKQNKDEPHRNVDSSSDSGSSDSGSSDSGNEISYEEHNNNENEKQKI